MIGKYDELIKIMKEVKDIIDSPNTDINYSRYNTVEDVIKDLDPCIERLKQKDKSVIEKLKISCLFILIYFTCFTILENNPIISNVRSRAEMIFFYFLLD